ncbi:hypothetical protein [Nonomuraea fuscirosea]|uniref:hypothetical protein n=1 Tax=Nonomuraea fuscirosea TaxID=1291556 RepID=UPI003446C5F1
MTRLIRAESYRLLVTRLRPSTLPIRPPSSVVDLAGPAGGRDGRRVAASSAWSA